MKKIVMKAIVFLSPFFETIFLIMLSRKAIRAFADAGMLVIAYNDC